MGYNMISNTFILIFKYNHWDTTILAQYKDLARVFLTPLFFAKNFKLHICQLLDSKSSYQKKKKNLHPMTYLSLSLSLVEMNLIRQCWIWWGKKMILTYILCIYTFIFNKFEYGYYKYIFIWIFILFYFILNLVKCYSINDN